MQASFEGILFSESNQSHSTQWELWVKREEGGAGDKGHWVLAKSALGENPAPRTSQKPLARSEPPQRAWEGAASPRMIQCTEKLIPP